MCLTYKWTIDEVDMVPMPMIFTLMKKLGEFPSTDILQNAQLNASVERFKQQQVGAIQKFGAVKGKVRRRTDGD